MATIQMEFLSIDFQRNQIGVGPNISQNGDFFTSQLINLEAGEWGKLTFETFLTLKNIIPQYFPFTIGIGENDSLPIFLNMEKCQP